MIVRIHDPVFGYVRGEVVRLMTYGAVVKYITGGIEFIEMLGEEDYEVVMEEEDVD